jgi:hypothetical protein
MKCVDGKKIDILQAVKMSSMPIEWHENCLKNATESLRRKQLQLEALEVEVGRDAENLRFHAKQIAEAQKRGLKSFDSERLLKSRK